VEEGPPNLASMTESLPTAFTNVTCGSMESRREVTTACSTSSGLLSGLAVMVMADDTYMQDLALEPRGHVVSMWL
jgi:hypothetical protein